MGKGGLKEQWEICIFEEICEIWQSPEYNPSLIHHIPASGARYK